MDLFSNLRERLTAKGYLLVKTSKEADFALYVNVLFANNLKEANTIRAAVLGGAIGSSSDNLYATAAFALAGGIIGKFSEDDVFRSVIDITVRDYHDSNVIATKITSIGDPVLKNTNQHGVLNSMAGSLRSTNTATQMASNIKTTTQQRMERNFSQHETRAFIEAKRVNLKPDEALPILQQKAARQIANIF